MVAAIAQHHVVEAEPGFGGCHAKCTDEYKNIVGDALLIGDAEENHRWATISER
ncbi:hypothetical protein MKW94_026402 [Papaver nudicaule]|uniref:Uncharacterized protein n=1 Tax=Papaver nudicaule TaxID=74823 RepID=A0AA42AYC2_PAPNU|nr:hypothetical protein [Papaver nudicaule]